MLTEAMTGLAAEGAAALVSVMGTVGWPAGKEYALELFTADNPAQRAATEARLERSVAALDGLGAGEVSRVKASLRVAWATRFEELLETRPDAAPVVRALVALLRS